MRNARSSFLGLALGALVTTSVFGQAAAPRVAAVARSGQASATKSPTDAGHTPGFTYILFWKQNDPATQQKVFDLLKINAEEAEKRFGFLLEALRYGAPPHGGIALGLDRWVMLFAGYDNIRDVIAFPKTQRASDLLTGAPSEVDTRQLRDLHIQCVQ